MTSGLLAGALLLASSATSAAPVWVGDMETGDTSQWNELNGEHITIVPAPVAQGMYAARIELTNDALWPNGLHRVELHHSPAGGRTDEGAELYFA
ncbi:MAG TPA: concanavalin A-like lectin/glucanase-domain-containing protein, partial [Polyangiaceae bacterium]|nr:concanavalin A-like lectin/glucanase-domain-containing protein [Polyangiaceae bacterium]